MKTRTDSTPKTPYTHGEEFLAELANMGFKPGKWDQPGQRYLNVNNAEGHPTLRVCVDYEGEERPSNISLVKFTGTKAQMIEWEAMHLTCYMPSAGILALIKSAM